MKNLKQSKEYITEIIDGMFDWVRVLDLMDNVVFMNRAMTEKLSSAKLGEKCYEAAGRNSPCENCISRKVIKCGETQEKEEIIYGKTFQVMSSPIKNPEGDVIAIVEVLRDVSDLKVMQQELLKQNKDLRENMNVARELQRRLLPKAFDDYYLTFNYIYKPSETLGGDFLDIFRIDETHMGLCIADVSGHGVPASMLTVFLHSSINKHLLSPSAVLSELYRDFNRIKAYEEMYITVFYAILDLEAKTIKFANAGHNASPMLISENSVTALKQPGIPLSDWPVKPTYSDISVEYESGDKLLLFTDGIIEIRNQENEVFGKRRLLDHFFETAGPASGVMEAAISKACAFGGIYDISGIPDDITIAMLEFK